MRNFQNDNDSSRNDDDSPRSGYGDSPLISCDDIEEGEILFRVGDTFISSVVVHSLDGDGCFLPHFNKTSSYCTMAEYNQPFFLALLEQAKFTHEKIVILPGSARQGWYRDLMNMFKMDVHGGSVTESYFFALQQFVADINSQLPEKKQVTLDPFLLDDISPHRNNGDSFKKALEYGTEWSEVIKSAVNDEKKLILLSRQTDFQNARIKIAEQCWQNAERIYFCEHPGKFALLYAQIHHIASQFPKELPLQFHFYDDRLDILGPLVAVFFHASDLVPKNMTLYFHHYHKGSARTNPEDNTPIVKKVQGSGVIDSYYKETVCDMFAKLEASEIKVVNKALQVRLGDPLNHFFKIEIQRDFISHQIEAPAFIVTSSDAFQTFNKRRLDHLTKETSFADFFTELQRSGFFSDEKLSDVSALTH